MKLVWRMMIPAAIAVGLLAVTCTVSTTGAPCETRDNCPAGQFCSIEKTCHSDQRDAPCEEDAHCPAGEFCNAGTCTQGESPALDAGTDAGADTGPAVDAGSDAGQIECAIDGNCAGEHVQNAKCSAGRCEVTCETGWEDANHDVLKDGCEKEMPCQANGGIGLFEECRTSFDCNCGKNGSNCVKGLYDFFGTTFDRGECLEDCTDNSCSDGTAKCLQPKQGAVPEKKSCFKTGKLKGTFTVLLKNDCKDSFGDTRVGHMNLVVGGQSPTFSLFTGCRKTDADPDYVEVQGFSMCDQTPCRDIIDFSTLVSSLATTEVLYPAFNAIWMDVIFNGSTPTTMTIKGVADGGKIFNLLKTAETSAGMEYKGEVDVDMIGYDLDVCGGRTGVDCAEVLK